MMIINCTLLAKSENSKPNQMKNRKDKSKNKGTSTKARFVQSSVHQCSIDFTAIKRSYWDCDKRYKQWL